MKRAHYSKRMLPNRIALSFAGALYDKSFFENSFFADFSHVVRVKNNQDSVQPLVAFQISNISYWALQFCCAMACNHTALVGEKFAYKSQAWAGHICLLGGVNHT